jgi:hypothetical protein
MTTAKTALMLLVVFAAAFSTVGCSSVQQLALQDRRDAPWDPRGSKTLFDQIPNETGGALRRCCGHLRSCEAHQTPRC